MKFSTYLIVAGLASFIATPPSALDEKDTIEAHANWDWAYNGNSPTKRGPRTLYNCSKASKVRRNKSLSIVDLSNSRTLGRHFIRLLRRLWSPNTAARRLFIRPP